MRLLPPKLLPRTLFAVIGLAIAGIAGETRSGKLILPAPLDYIPWVKSTEDPARRAALQGGGTLAALLRQGDAARGAGTGSARLARKR